MKFVFDYTETLTRRVVIDATSLRQALTEIENQIEGEEIVLGAEDFVGGEITMPLSENYLPQLHKGGEDVKTKDDLDLVIDFW